MKNLRKAMMCVRCAPPRASFRGGRGKARELTVTSLYRAGGDDGRTGAVMPYLRISGRWLEELGFATGSRVVVAGERGKLTLTVAGMDDRASTSLGERRTDRPPLPCSTSSTSG